MNPDDTHILKQASSRKNRRKNQCLRRPDCKSKIEVTWTETLTAAFPDAALPDVLGK